VKIISFSSLEATLLAYPSMESLPLSGNLSWQLGGRTCVGKWLDGVYCSCDSPEIPACGACRELNACAICAGRCLKNEKTCTQEHALYIAMFRPNIFKIGVAKVRRLSDRLREQGADVAAVVEYFPDGELARRRERELQHLSGIKGTVRESQKRQVDAEIDWASWEAIKAKMNTAEPRTLHYFDLPLWMRPLPLKNELRGHIIGVKGRLLVLERDSTLYAFDLKDMLGAEVVPYEGSTRQTSLAAF